MSIILYLKQLFLDLCNSSEKKEENSRNKEREIIQLLLLYYKWNKFPLEKTVELLIKWKYED